MQVLAVKADETWTLDICEQLFVISKHVIIVDTMFVKKYQ